MKRAIEAAIFDVDGTLLDTREFIFQAYEYALATHGHAVPPRDVMATYIGRVIKETYDAFAPDADFKQIMRAHAQFQSERLGLVVAYEGLHEMLATLKHAGIQVGAFSSRYRNLVPTLEQVGVREYFDVIVQGDEVRRHKPDPEGLYLALGRVGVGPEQAAMVGDAAVDIMAGKGAGVAVTIGITHGFGTQEALLAAEPDYIVDRLSAIPPLLLGDA